MFVKPFDAPSAHASVKEGAIRFVRKRTSVDARLLSHKTSLERTLPRAYYFDDAIYAREQECIFHREWFLACREEQVGKAGDYLALDVAGESIIIVRTRDGTLRAHYNVLRGTAAAGSWKNLRMAPSRGGIRCCPYHSWTYELDGQAAHCAVSRGEADGVRKDELGLASRSAVRMVWGGFVFVNLMPESAVAHSARSRGANWKALPDRLSNDIRSRTLPHREHDRLQRRRELESDARELQRVLPLRGRPSSELSALVPDFSRNAAVDSDFDWDRGIPHREGAYTFTFSGTTDCAGCSPISTTTNVHAPGRRELIYPNFMLSLSADHVAAFTVFPRGPLNTTIVCDFLFHPDEMRKANFDPSDAVGFWDLTNRQDWAICESVQRGMHSRVWEYGYYAPMERFSLDLRRYVNERLGP